VHFYSIQKRSPSVPELSLQIRDAVQSPRSTKVPKVRPVGLRGGGEGGNVVKLPFVASDDVAKS